MTTENTTTALTTATGGAIATGHYRGTDAEGNQFDSSYDRDEPISFVVGSGQMISGFDAAVDGMSVGETKTVTLAPAEAYGDVNPEAKTTFPKSGFPEGIDVKVGMRVPLRAPNGQTIIGFLTEEQEDTVTVDLNHPLAGQTLQFEIELVEVTTETTTTTSTDEETAT